MKTDTMVEVVLAPVHPGEIIREEFLAPLGMTPYRLAKGLGVAQPRVAEILGGRRGISADTAIRLSRYLGCSPEFWMNFQSHYELTVARRQSTATYEAIQPRDGLSRAA